MLPFPLLSGMATILLFASFLTPIFASPELMEWIFNASKDTQGDNSETHAQMVITIASCAFYFINYFIVVFFNTALVACAARRIKGEDSTVGYGLQVACSRLPQIVGWVLLAASVGVVLRAVSERSALLGKIVVSLVGASWTVATCLVVPTLVLEGLGPIAALKRSSRLIGSSWGEGLSGAVGLELLDVPIYLLGIVLMFFSFCIGSMTALVLSCLYFAVLMCVSSALRQIFIVGLYLYAAEKRIPPGFSAELLDGAFFAER